MATTKKPTSKATPTAKGKKPTGLTQSAFDTKLDETIKILKNSTAFAVVALRDCPQEHGIECMVARGAKPVVLEHGPSYTRAFMEGLTDLMGTFMSIRHNAAQIKASPAKAASKKAKKSAAPKTSKAVK